MPTPTTPTHNLCIQRRLPVEERKPGAKNPNPFIKVGAGWETRSGGVALRFDDGMVPDWRMNETHRIFAFPVRDWDEGDPGPSS